MKITTTSKERRTEKKHGEKCPIDFYSVQQRLFGRFFGDGVCIARARLPSVNCKHIIESN